MIDPNTITVTTQVISAVGNLADTLVSVAPKIIATCSVLATVFKKPASSAVLSISSPLTMLHSLVNLMAFNFGHATNKSSTNQPSADIL